MRLGQKNEFFWIRWIRSRVRTDARVRKGIGDDAAVLKAASGKDLLFTTDMLIEGRHFRRKEHSPYDIGKKALAVNISDIAAMGGTPTHAVVSLGLPADSSARFLKQFYKGLLSTAKAFKVNVVGGDTNRSGRIIISVALLGEAPKGRAVLRSGAKPGDWLFVSGKLGGSYASKRHLRFKPAVLKAKKILRHAKPHAMLDLSDGLASDLRRLAEESRVGICVEEAAIPLAAGVKGARQALSEGEDFELLFAVRPAAGRRLEMKSARLLGFKCYRIGRVLPRAKGLFLMTSGGIRKKLPSGFNHFASP